MGSMPLAPGTTTPHAHCACVQFWRHLLTHTGDVSYIARVWRENTELLQSNRELTERVRTLEADMRIHAMARY